MTVTRCIAACNELGYGWAGLQNRERESHDRQKRTELTRKNVSAPNRTLGRTLLLWQRSITARFHATVTRTSDVEDGDMLTCTILPWEPHRQHPMGLTTESLPLQDIKVSQLCEESIMD